MEGEQVPDIVNRIEHESSAEMIPLGPDTLVVVDLDRTLIDSDRLVDITLLSMEDNLRDSSIDDEATKQAIAAIERVREQQKQQTGNSFAYLEALKKAMGTTDAGTAEGLAKQVLAANRDDRGDIRQSFINQIMLPGALEILDEIDKRGSDWLIQTAGEDLTQRYKLLLFKAIYDEYQPEAPPLSYLITDPGHHLSKAEMIDQSRVADKYGRLRFDVGLLTKYSHFASVSGHTANRQYDKIVLLDDKLKNLQYRDGALAKPDITTILVKADSQLDQDGQSLTSIQERFE